jgi:predicted metal-dependent HD superfamily phosphohydrolase
LSGSKNTLSIQGGHTEKKLYLSYLIYKLENITKNMDLQQLLNKWGIKCDVNTLLSMWNESHRHYHNLNHLNDLLDMINENQSKYSQNEYEKLILTALFHDCVYDPMRNDNEEKSAEFFVECLTDKSNSDLLEVKQMILDTKTHQPNTKLSESFINYDMSIVERNFEDLLEWEKGIREEYKSYGEEYKEGRLKFLESLLDKYPNNTENLLKLVDWVKENY